MSQIAVFAGMLKSPGAKGACGFLGIAVLVGLAAPVQGAPVTEPGLSGRTDIVFFEGFEQAAWGQNWVYADPAQTVPQPVFQGQRSLQVHCPTGEHSTNGWNRTAYSGVNRIFARAYYYFPTDFAIAPCNSLKLFAVGALPPTAPLDGYSLWKSGVVPNGSDFFNTMLVLENNWDLAFYYYNPEQPSIYGATKTCNQVSSATITRGQWHSIELMCQANDPGQHNGVIQAWIDGRLCGKVEGIRFRDLDTLRLREMATESYFGGAGAVNTSPKNQDFYIDNLVLSTNYIGTSSTSSSSPTISQQPQSQSVTVGQTATFTGTASGTAALSYQWQKQDPGGTSFADIAGATAASHTTASTTAAMSGTQYRLRVSNSAGSVTSSAATLTVTTTALPPTVSQQPQNKTVTVGQTATFTTAAGGTAPLTIQWQKQDPGGAGFADIPGATEATYATPTTTVAMSGTQYRVRVSNSAGNVTSSAATLTVNASADADSDGLPDAWEQQHFGGLSQAAGGDPDSDGSTNLEEFHAGTDPMDPFSYPGAVPTSGSSGGSEEHTPCGFGSAGARGSTWPLLLLAAVSLGMTLLRRR